MWNVLAAEFRRFLEQDVADFNAAMKKLGFAPVVVPRKVVPL
ncbi:MAG: hypothetical protein ABIT38_00465 [Gemmatimonadaceae bacterium]